MLNTNTHEFNAFSVFHSFFFIGPNQFKNLHSSAHCHLSTPMGGLQLCSSFLSSCIPSFLVFLPHFVISSLLLSFLFFLSSHPFSFLSAFLSLQLFFISFSHSWFRFFKVLRTSVKLRAAVPPRLCPQYHSAVSSPSVSLCRVFALSITLSCLRPRYHSAVSSPSVSLCRVFALSITQPCLRPQHYTAVSSPSVSLCRVFALGITLSCLRPRYHSAVFSPSVSLLCLRPQHHCAVSSA